MKLDIKHVTQMGNGISNDCSQACVNMLAPDLSLSDIIKASGVQPNGYATFQNVYQALRFAGLSFEYWRPSDATAIRGSLANGNPSILLIGYGLVPPSLKRSNGNWPHFVLATGYDKENIFIHDSLGNAQNGKHIPYPDTILMRAMEDVPYSNYANQAILISHQYPTVDENDPVDNTIALLEQAVAELEKKNSLLQKLINEQAKTISSLRLILTL